MGLHSIMAFPRTLGLDFQSSNPPRVHSFGWNCGLRNESQEYHTLHKDIKSLISREELTRYADVYFSTVHPIFGVLDEKIFLEQVEKFWTAELHIHSVFESILAGTVALGSFFSNSNAHPQEAAIVQHAKDILEDESFPPTVDHVSGWILRTLYLRSTARPHRAWLASSTSMHLAEATGLHHEMDSMTLVESSRSHHPPKNQKGCEQARRIFWCAWLTNIMISYEYGRSNTVLSSISCKLPQPISGEANFTYLIISIGHLAPISGLDSAKPDVPGILEKLLKIPDQHPFISLSKADLCMSLYRHSRLLKQPLEKDTILSILKIGNTATTAALSLAESQKWWWNVLCTVFQYVCVLLAIDTAESLANVSSTMGALDKITALLGTHMAREASNTAKVLLRDSMKKKRQEVALLEKADTGQSAVDGGGVEAGGFDIDWDSLLDPWFMSQFAMQEFENMMGNDGMVPTL